MPLLTGHIRKIGAAPSPREGEKYIRDKVCVKEAMEMEEQHRSCRAEMILGGRAPEMCRVLIGGMVRVCGLV